MAVERKPARTFEDLLVWQKAHEHVLTTYKLTASFPKHEIYGLSGQMRRAAVSIAANVAEGFKKRGVADKARFLNTAEGSLEENRYYLLLTRDLGYGEVAQPMADLEDLSKLLNAYANAIRSSCS